MLSERMIRFTRTYGHILPSVALLLGFVWDALTLKRPDTLFENMTVTSYLLVAGGSILMLSMRSGVVREQKLVWLTLLQFTFGNLASALFVLYMKSGAFTSGIIFISALVALLVSNEFLKERYTQTWVNVSVWFLLLLTYSTIIVPVLLNDFGDSVFLEGVAVAAFIMAAFVAILSVFARETVREHMVHIVAGIFSIGILFVGLYYTGGIPPVPLAVKTIAIVHHVERTSAGYDVQYEPKQWYECWRDTGRTFTTNQTRAYCFSAVFAPTDIETVMYHHWEHKSSTGEWVSVSRIPFSISGGRTTGYRGYTITEQLQLGEWRCSAETERGAVIGRAWVTVVRGEAPTLSEEVW